MTPRAAVQGLIGDLHSSGEFLELATRGRDGTEIEAVSAFEGQDSPGAVPDPKVRDVQLCFGLDKGGQISSCKAILSILNQEHPCSRGNTILYGVFPCKKDDHDALSRMAAVYVPDIDALRTGGVEVSGERRAVRLILLGDYCFITLWWPYGRQQPHAVCVLHSNAMPHSAQRLIGGPVWGHASGEQGTWHPAHVNIWRKWQRHIKTAATQVAGLRCH